MPTEPGLAPSPSDWEVIETKDEPAAAPPAKVAPALPTKGEPTPAPPTVTVAAAASAAAAQAVQAATNVSLSTAMREEVWTIVRAAVTEAMTPVVARQKDLEAQLDAAAKVKPAAAPPPLPVAAAAPVPAAPVAAAAPPAAAAAKHSSSPPPAKTASIPVAVSTSSPPVATSYGLVMTAQRRSDEIDLAAIARAPVDYDGFDGNRRKRIITRLLVTLILLGFAGLVTMTILSHG